MAGHSYEESKKLVYKGLGLLALITIVEVLVSLFAKGHIIAADFPKMILWAAGLAIIILSLYKAYYIVYRFMHMGDEASAFRISVLMPLILLIWAIIAFLWEGDYWKDARSYVLLKDESVNEKSIQPVGGVPTIDPFSNQHEKDENHHGDDDHHDGGH